MAFKRFLAHAEGEPGSGHVSMSKNRAARISGFWRMVERRTDLTIRAGSKTHVAVAEFDPEAQRKLVVMFAETTVEGEGVDLFECLVAVRRQLETSNLQICCQTECGDVVTVDEQRSQSERLRSR